MSTADPSVHTLRVQQSPSARSDLQTSLQSQGLEETSAAGLEDYYISVSEIFQADSWATVFGNDKPVVWEFPDRTGQRLLDQLRAYPDRNFVLLGDVGDNDFTPRMYPRDRVKIIRGVDLPVHDLFLHNFPEHLRTVERIHVDFQRLRQGTIELLMMMLDQGGQLVLRTLDSQMVERMELGSQVIGRGHLETSRFDEETAPDDLPLRVSHHLNAGHSMWELRYTHAVTETQTLDPENNPAFLLAQQLWPDEPRDVMWYPINGQPWLAVRGRSYILAGNYIFVPNAVWEARIQDLEPHQEHIIVVDALGDLDDGFASFVYGRRHTFYAVLLLQAFAHLLEGPIVGGGAGDGILEVLIERLTEEGPIYAVERDMKRYRPLLGVLRANGLLGLNLTSRVVPLPLDFKELKTHDEGVKTANVVVANLVHEGFDQKAPGQNWHRLLDEALQPNVYFLLGVERLKPGHARTNPRFTRDLVQEMQAQGYRVVYAFEPPLLEKVRYGAMHSVLHPVVPAAYVLVRDPGGEELSEMDFMEQVRSRVYAPLNAQVARLREAYERADLGDDKPFDWAYYRQQFHEVARVLAPNNPEGPFQEVAQEIERLGEADRQRWNHAVREARWLVASYLLETSGVLVAQERGLSQDVSMDAEESLREDWVDLQEAIDALNSQTIPEADPTRLTDEEWDRLLRLRITEWNFYGPFGEQPLAHSYETPESGLFYTSDSRQVAEAMKAAEVGSDSRVHVFGAGAGHDGMVAAAVLGATVVGDDLHDVVDQANAWRDYVSAADPNLINEGQVQFYQANAFHRRLEDFTHGIIYDPYQQDEFHNRLDDFLAENAPQGFRFLFNSVDAIDDNTSLLLTLETEWEMSEPVEQIYVFENTGLEEIGGLVWNDYVVPPARLFQLNDWEELFGNDRPVAWEIGLGNGMALRRRALDNPHQNFLGIDLPGSSVWRDVAQDEPYPENVRFVAASVADLGEALPTHLRTVDQIYLDFPSENTAEPATFEQMMSVLRKGGQIRVLTESEAVESAVRQAAAAESNAEGVFVEARVLSANDIPGDGLFPSVELVKRFLLDDVPLRTVSYLAVGLEEFQAQVKMWNEHAPAGGMGPKTSLFARFPEQAQFLALHLADRIRMGDRQFRIALLGSGPKEPFTLPAYLLWLRQHRLSHELSELQRETGKVLHEHWDDLRIQIDAVDADTSQLDQLHFYLDETPLVQLTETPVAINLANQYLPAIRALGWIQPVEQDITEYVASGGLSETSIVVINQVLINWLRDGSNAAVLDFWRALTALSQPLTVISTRPDVSAVIDSIVDAKELDSSPPLVSPQGWQRAQLKDAYSEALIKPGLEDDEKTEPPQTALDELGRQMGIPGTALPRYFDRQRRRRMGSSRGTVVDTGSNGAYYAQLAREREQRLAAREVETPVETFQEVVLQPQHWPIRFDRNVSALVDEGMVEIPLLESGIVLVVFLRRDWAGQRTDYLIRFPQGNHLYLGRFDLGYGYDDEQDYEVQRITARGSLPNAPFSDTARIYLDEHELNLLDTSEQQDDNAFLKSRLLSSDNEALAIDTQTVSHLNLSSHVIQQMIAYAGLRVMARIQRGHTHVFVQSRHLNGFLHDLAVSVDHDIGTRSLPEDDGATERGYARASMTQMRRGLRESLSGHNEALRGVWVEAVGSHLQQLYDHGWARIELPTGQEVVLTFRQGFETIGELHGYWLLDAFISQGPDQPYRFLGRFDLGFDYPNDLYLAGNAISGGQTPLPGAAEQLLDDLDITGSGRSHPFRLARTAPLDQGVLHVDAEAAAFSRISERDVRNAIAYVALALFGQHRHQEILIPFEGNAFLLDLFEGRASGFTNNAIFVSAHRALDRLQDRLQSPGFAFLPKQLTETLPNEFKRFKEEQMIRLPMRNGELILIHRHPSKGLPMLSVDAFVRPTGKRPLYFGRVDLKQDPMHKQMAVSDAGPHLDFAEKPRQFLLSENIATMGAASVFTSRRQMPWNDQAIYVNPDVLEWLGISERHAQDILAFVGMKILVSEAQTILRVQLAPETSVRKPVGDPNQYWIELLHRTGALIHGDASGSASLLSMHRIVRERLDAWAGELASAPSQGGLEEEEVITELVRRVWGEIELHEEKRQVIPGVEMQTIVAPYAAVRQLGKFLVVSEEEWLAHQPELEPHRDNVIIASFRTSDEDKTITFSGSGMHTEETILLLQALPSLVQDRIVVDGGAGEDMVLTVALHRLGAARIFAIEGRAEYRETAVKYLELNRVSGIDLIFDDFMNINRYVRPGEVEVVFSSLADSGLMGPFPVYEHFTGRLIGTQLVNWHVVLGRLLRPQWYVLLGAERNKEHAFHQANASALIMQGHGWRPLLEKQRGNLGFGSAFTYVFAHPMAPNEGMVPELATAAGQSITIGTPDVESAPSQSGLEEPLPMDIRLPDAIMGQLQSASEDPGARVLAQLLQGDIQRFFLEEIPLSAQLVDEIAQLERTEYARNFETNYENRPDQYDAFLRWLNIDFLLPRGLVLNHFTDGSQDYLWLRYSDGYELFNIPESDLPVPIVYIDANFEEDDRGIDQSFRGMGIVRTVHNQTRKVADEEYIHSVDYYRFQEWVESGGRTALVLVTGGEGQQIIRHYGVEDQDLIDRVDSRSSVNYLHEIRAGIQGVAGPDGQAYWDDYMGAVEGRDGGLREAVGLWLIKKITDHFTSGEPDFSAVQAYMPVLWAASFRDAFQMHQQRIHSFGESLPPDPLQSGLEEQQALRQLIYQIWPQANFGEMGIALLESDPPDLVTLSEHHAVLQVGDFLFVSRDEWDAHHGKFGRFGSQVIVADMAKRSHEQSGQESWTFAYSGVHGVHAALKMQKLRFLFEGKRVFGAGSGSDAVLETLAARLGASEIVLSERDPLKHGQLESYLSVNGVVPVQVYAQDFLTIPADDFVVPEVDIVLASLDDNGFYEGVSSSGVNAHRELVLNVLPEFYLLLGAHESDGAGTDGTTVVSLFDGLDLYNLLWNSGIEDNPVPLGIPTGYFFMRKDVTPPEGWNALLQRANAGGQEEAATIQRRVADALQDLLSDVEIPSWQVVGPSVVQRFPALVHLIPYMNQFAVDPGADGSEELLDFIVEHHPEIQVLNYHTTNLAEFEHFEAAAAMQGIRVVNVPAVSGRPTLVQWLQQLLSNLTGMSLAQLDQVLDLQALAGDLERLQSA